MDEKTRQMIENGVKDTMWACFWKGNQKANLEQLEENVYCLIRAATQKNAGQRGGATNIDWKNLEMILLNIAIEATALCLDSRFDELKRNWSDDSL